MIQTALLLFSFSCVALLYHNNSIQLLSSHRDESWVDNLFECTTRPEGTFGAHIIDEPPMSCSYGTNKISLRF